MILNNNIFIVNISGKNEEKEELKFSFFGLLVGR